MKHETLTHAQFLMVRKYVINNISALKIIFIGYILLVLPGWKIDRLAQDLNKSVDSCRIIIISSGFIESVGLRIDITFAKLHGILLINLILKSKKTLLTFKLSMNTVTHL